MIRTEEEHLAHYGIIRRSGRYPWGSGVSENTHNRNLLDAMSMLKKDGMSESEIAKGWGLTTTQLRAHKSIAVAQQRQEKQLTAQRLKDKGWSNVEIGKRMGVNESSVRALLAPGAKDKADALHTTAGMLKEVVDKHSMVDVGSGVEHYIGISRTRLDTSISLLREKHGYELHNIKIQQAGTGKFTTMKVLAKPGITLAYAQKNRKDIAPIRQFTDDQGRSYKPPIQPPLSIASRRVKVVYGPDGGGDLDGLIYVRPGVDDLRIGNKNYGQVRIAVDGTHYLKGMAVYKEGLPPGTDLVFNTKKSDTGRKKDAMKEMSDDPEFPFGSVVRQITDSNDKVSSVMNLVNEEGNWDKWSRTLSSQMLSKQNPKLAKQQLDLTFEARKKEFDEIKSLTNPTVRKELLNRFADSTDSASVHLKAANMPRQSNKVLLPINSIKPNEIYAPSMRDGERVVLIRFPHGGKFEIPELTVNNRNREARKILGSAAQDAVGIHHSVAKHLSGADFDGDTVLIIPNNKKQIERHPPLEGLKTFDPMTYKIPKGSSIPHADGARKQKEMGKVSNLITDMTIRGAAPDELARAVKHSMVVIDSEKHGLDWQLSERDHGILSLKEKYQGGKQRGAATLISKAKAEIRIPQRILRPPSQGGPIDPHTGKKVYVDTGYMIKERKKVTDPVTGKKHYVETGKPVAKEDILKKLEFATDAHSLIDRTQGTAMEVLYADHSNRLKAMANEARKESYHTKHAPTSSSAKTAYSKEVASLNSKVRVAEMNAPRERHAQLLTSVRVSQVRQANPHMESSEVKKEKNRALNTYRARTGAGKSKITITQSEWNAIQAGAVSTNVLNKVIKHSDPDSVKHLALPKDSPKMTPTRKATATTMLASGYTQAEVADKLGVSVSTLKVSLTE